MAPCLAACGLARGQDAATPPRAGARPAADDDFGPPGPPPARDERGQRGPRDFDRPGRVPGRTPGGQPGGPPREGFPGPAPFDRPGPPERPDGQGPHEGPGRPPGPGEPPPGMPRWPHGDWQSMEQSDPEMFKLLQSDVALERKSRELAMQCRQAPEDQRAAIKQKLEAAVAEHFQARQQRRSLELKRLEEELKRLRESIDKRNASEKEIVGRRVSELLGTRDEPEF